MLDAQFDLGKNKNNLGQGIPIEMKWYQNGYMKRRYSRRAAYKK